MTVNTRVSMFSSPLLLGFDQFERTLDRISKSSGEGYPPYNIEQVGEDGLRITLAVAGFTTEDLSIQVEDNQLIIRGRQEDDKSRIYLHRGIASRQFQRSFVLADGIEVDSANLDAGLLHIDLRRPIPEPKVKRIRIDPGPTNGSSKGGETTVLQSTVVQTNRSSEHNGSDRGGAASAVGAIAERNGE